ncbi:MAG: hypothetical protein AAFR14_09380 [Bacteroidota bacterium]
MTLPKLIFNEELLAHTYMGKWRELFGESRIDQTDWWAEATILECLFRDGCLTNNSVGLAVCGENLIDILYDQKAVLDNLQPKLVSYNSLRSVLRPKEFSTFLRDGMSKLKRSTTQSKFSFFVSTWLLHHWTHEEAHHNITQMQTKYLDEKAPIYLAIALSEEPELDSGLVTNQTVSRPEIIDLLSTLSLDGISCKPSVDEFVEWVELPEMVVLKLSKDGLV